MSEMFDPQHEGEPIDLSHIKRARSDIYLKADSYIDMHFMLLEYLEKDLGFTDREAEQHLLQCEAQGIVPPQRLYDENQPLAEDILRLSFYKTWMPMYQFSHTSEEFEAWVPELMRIVVPPEVEKQRHSTQTCFPSYHNDRTVLDGACAVSSVCPVKIVTNDLVYNLPWALDGMDYMFDREKACRNTQILLSAAHKADIITDLQKGALKRQYLASYSQRFPRPEASH